MLVSFTLYGKEYRRAGQVSISLLWPLPKGLKNQRRAGSAGMRGPQRGSPRWGAHLACNERAAERSGVSRSTARALPRIPTKSTAWMPTI